MKKVFDFVGGRKLTVFFLLLIINSVLAAMGKFSAEFGNFCIMLGSVYVVGNVGVALGKKDVS